MGKTHYHIFQMISSLLFVSPISEKDKKKKEKKVKVNLKGDTGSSKVKQDQKPEKQDASPHRVELWSPPACNTSRDRSISSQTKYMHT